MEGGHVQVGNEVNDTHCTGHQLGKERGGRGEGGGGRGEGGGGRGEGGGQEREVRRGSGREREKKGERVVDGLLEMQFIIPVISSNTKNNWSALGSAPSKKLSQREQILSHRHFFSSSPKIHTHTPTSINMYIPLHTCN